MNLGPLRDALLDEAEAGAERRRAEVEAERAKRLADARAKASALVEEGRLEGRRAAKQEGARRRGAARRRAREAELAARGALFEELRRRARAGAFGLRVDPTYPELLDRLAEAAQAQLGADAELEVDRPGTGGVVARSGRRSVDYTLPALADRALADLDGEVEKLWR
jgi:vacuolar-type H+-ATPase subunit E/Vma4